MEINDIIRPENKVYSKPELLEEVHMHYCPGCSHGVIHKLVAEVVATGRDIFNSISFHSRYPAAYDFLQSGY